MKSKIAVVAIMVFAVMLLNACVAGDPPAKIVADDLGLDLEGGVIYTSIDDHGGFLGDGSTFISVHFWCDEALKQIEGDKKWRPFPADGTVKALLNRHDYCGVSFNGEEGYLQVQPVQNGYYRLIDRQEDKEGDILSRSSYNYTLGIYDVDRGVLYYLALDT